MKFRSVVPLNSAPDAGRRINFYGLSRDAERLLDMLGILHHATIAEAMAIVENKMKLMNVAQRQETLKRMGALLRVSR